MRVGLTNSHASIISLIFNVSQVFWPVRMEL